MLSSDSITVVATDKLNCFSDQTIHKSREAIVDYGNLTAKGSNLNASFKQVSLISNIINTIAKQVIAKAQNYIRHTEDYDQIKAGKMARNVSGLYSMNTKYTVMVSKKDTKIDGERIHMG